MLKNAIQFENEPHLGEDDPREPEARIVRRPVKRSSSQKKQVKRPVGLAPDAKRYNDEIPDPDAEDTIPE